ncbi:MAG: cytochrome c oxidase subunit 3 [Acidimicrobiales bacterium]
MYALPAAPPSAPRRQLFVGTALACAAGTTLYGGLIALFVRYRQEALAITGGEWKPADVKIPEVPTNVNLLAFLFIGIFAQWGVYAAKRQHKGGVGMSVGLVGLLGIAVINSLSFVYFQMGMGIADGTYQLFFYAVTGTFIALTVVGVAFSVVTAFRFLGGRWSEREIVSAHAMYWYFLGAMYIVLWFVVFVTK